VSKDVLKKLGRPFMNEGKRLNKLMAFKIDKTDYVKIEKIAKKLKLNSNEYCRRCVLNEIKKVNNTE